MTSVTSPYQRLLVPPFQSVGLVSGLLILVLCLFSLNLNSQNPCDDECCPNGPQHTFEGSTGALPPFGTTTNGGWEAKQGTPSYETMDGCDGSVTSVELKGFNPLDEAIFSHSGFVGQDTIFLAGKTYCIQLCVKATQLVPDFEVYAGSTAIQVINVASTNWTTVQFNWTAPSDIFSISIRNINFETIGLFDNLCISEVTPENGCMADFSIEQFDCGIVCLTDESCGEYNPNVTWTAFNASTNQTINPNQENPCLSLYDGSWFIQLIIKCSDGTTSTKDTTITVTGSPDPQITCPPNQTITAGNSSPCEAEYIMPIISHTSGTFECFINGVPVTAGTAYFLPEGVNNVYCLLTDECNVEEECQYQITVECEGVELDTLCGEAVISCFSNNTFGTSNPNGYVLAIVHNKDWASAPLGANWTAASSSIYHHSSWTAANLGEIFGLAIDNKDFIYATTTSLYGKNLGGPAGQGGIYKINPVSGAITNFVSTGAYVSTGTGNTIPNDGAGLGNICYDSDNDQFYVTNFYDGYIYQISNTGIVKSRFNPFPGGTTSSSPTFIELGHRPWGIAYNPIDKRLYFSNWVSIRSAPSNGPTTIHSINVASGGFDFLPAQLEITLSMYNPTDMPISDIAVSTDGKLLMSNKAAYADYATSAHTGSLWAHIGAVYEYENVGPWQLTPGHGFNPKYNVGAPGRFDAAGGIDYGYESTDNLNRPQFCDASVWATGDYLHGGLPTSNIYYGLQGMPNTGGNNSNSVIIDYDNVVNTYAKASFGDVEIFKCGCYVSEVDCDSLMVMSRPLECIDPYVGKDIEFCTLEYLPVCGCDGNTYSNACHAERDGVTVYIPGECDTVTVPSLDSMCCYMIDLKNNWGADIVELEAQLLGSEWIYNNVNLYPPFSFGSCGSYNQKFCLKESGGGPIPGGTTASAAYVCFTPTVSNPTSNPQIKFTWKELVNETDMVGICMDTLTFECIPKPPLPCLEIINKEAICDPEDPTLYDLCFNVVNNSGVDVCDLTLECPDPIFCFDPFCRNSTIEAILPSPLATGNTSAQICVKIETLVPITSPQDVCLKAGLVSCDGTECCHDPVKVCFPIEPCCDPCEDRDVTFNSVNINENECCYSVDITNDCLIDYFVGLRLKVQTPGVCIGTHLMNPIHSPNWTTSLSPTEVTFTPISGFLDQTSYNDLFTFCLDKIDNASQAFPTVVLEWLYVNPITGQIEVACENPFTTECEPIVNDSCLAVIERDIKCIEDPGKYQFDFTIINQSKFDACNVHIKIIDPITGYFVLPGSIIPLTSSPLPNGGSESLSVCFQGTPFPATGSNFIIEYRLEGCDPNDCCRESVRDTIPIPPCDDCCDITKEEFCAQLEDIITPTNSDPCAPCFDFSKVDSCSSIGISIDGDPFISPELEESCYSFTTGTHTICFDYKRWKSGSANQDSLCMEKDTCLTFVCDTTEMTCLACPEGSSTGQDLIINGNFEGGNAGWNSGYTVITNTTSTTSTGEVSVRNSTNLQNTQWCGLDHSGLGTFGNFLTINGPSTSVAYQANVNIQPNTDYVFCMWVANLVCSSTNSAPVIEVRVNGIPQITNVAIPQINFQWNLITFNWNSGALTGSIPIQVFDIANVQFNDWAIDDVSFVECVPVDLCCEDEEAFCAQFEDIITSTSGDPCAPCFDFSKVDSCSSIGISIDGDLFISPELEESCYSFTTGTHTICFDYKRWKSGSANQDSLCMEKDTCLTFVCDTTEMTCLACPVGSSSGQDLIINGNFEGGNAGWNSGYTVITNTTSTTSTGEVSVRNSTNLQNTQWCGLDHSGLGTFGNFLTINGPSTSVAYQANVNVQPNTDYVFCMWVANLVCSSTNSAPVIEVRVNGIPQITNVAIPQINFQWNLITFNWNSGALTGSIPIQVFDIANVQFNDWAIDDVSFVECVSDTCCDDEEAFYDLVDLGFEIVYNDNCTVEVCANQFDSCHWFWTVGPDWGDGSIVLPTVIPSDPPNNCWTHTYSSAGAYNICINVEEYGPDGEACWNRQMCTTVEVDCPCEPTADCLEIISSETKDVFCDKDECYVNPFCQQWLRDLLDVSTNNGCQFIIDYSSFYRAMWNGQTVFVGYKSGAPDGGSQDIYTCDGTLIQSCTQGIGEICDPDAGIDISADLMAFDKFWDCGDALPPVEECGLATICDDDPWCNLWFRNLVQNTQLNCTGGFIYSFDTGLWGTTPVIIFEGAGPPDYGQNIIYTCDGKIIQDCQHTGGGGFFCSPDAGINISTDITARTNIWNCGDPIPALDPDCSIGDYTCVSYCTTVRNNTNPAIPVDKIFLSKITGNITVYPGVFNLIPDLQPNMTTVITYTVCGDFDPGDILKLNIGLEQTTEEWCCLSDEPLCLEVPPCPCPEVEDICELLDISASKIISGDQECCYDINITNDYCEDYFKGIVIHLNAPANISSIIANSGWVINQLDPQNAEIYPTGNYIPIGSNTPFTICNNSDSNYNVTLSWLVGLPDGTCEEICPEDVVLDNCDGFRCYEFVEDSLDCATNTYCFKIKNVSNPGFDLYSVHLFDLTGSLAFSPIQINIPNAPLTSGSTSDWICVNYSGVTSGDNVCYKLSAHNQPVGTPPTQCCTDTLTQCFTIEEDCCTPLSCDDVEITATGISNGANECCYDINIDNGYCEEYFKGIKVELGSTANISQVIAANGWSITALNSKEAEIFYTGGNIPLGAHTPFTICNTSNNDYTVSVSWLILLPDGTCEELCPVELELEHCIIEPPFTCYEIVEDSIDCTTDSYCFKIRNNSNPGFDIKSIHIYDVTPAGSLSPTGRINVGPISAGMTSDWICYTYSGVVDGDEVCFKVTAHNTPVGEVPTTCCTDTLEQCFTVEEDCCAPLSCDDLDISANKLTNGDNECCYEINIDNGYCEEYFKGIKVELGSTANISQVIAANGWSITALNNKEAEIFFTGGNIPLGNHKPFTICNTSTADYTLSVSWLIPLPDGTCEELCPVDLELEHCIIEPPFTCYEIVEDSIDCSTDSYCFKIRNNSNPGFDIKSIHIYDVTPAGSLSPTGRINVGPISAGMTSDWICYTYSGLIVGDDVCFKVTAHNTPVGEVPTACCTDTLEQCFTVECPPEPGECCNDEDEFCDLVDLGYVMSNDSSVLSIGFSQFDSCHWFATDGPNWGDGTPVTPGPINASGDHTWTHTYDTTGMYNICITVFEGTSEDSICWEKQICKMLWIVCEKEEVNPCEPTQMQVPTGITPNGDNINDLLIIQGPDLCTPIDLYIYNRWGQMVWNQKDYDDTWGGTSYNGEQLPDGTYFMILDYSNVNTQRKTNPRFQSYLDIRTE